MSLISKLTLNVLRRLQPLSLVLFWLITRQLLLVLASTCLLEKSYLPFLVFVIVLDQQSMLAKYLNNQFIPKMTSKPNMSNAIISTPKGSPSITKRHS